jgi:signal peptidase II
MNTSDQSISGGLTRGRLLLLGTMIGVLVCDQLTKVLVRVGLEPFDPPIELVPGLLNFSRVENTGAAFGLLSDLPDNLRLPLFTVISVLAIGGLLYFLGRMARDSLRLNLAMGGVFGGAVGNFIDRVRFGEVTDFIEVHIGSLHWPNFNVADMGITIGILLILPDLFSREPLTPPLPDDETEAEEPDTRGVSVERRARQAPAGEAGDD